MHATHAYACSHFALLVLTIAFALSPAHATPIPPSDPHTLNDPTATPAHAHAPRFWDGNADYVEHSYEPFRRRSDLNSLPATNPGTDLASLNLLEPDSTIGRAAVSKLTHLGSDKGILSATQLESLTNLDSVTDLGSVTNLSRRQPQVNSLAQLDTLRLARRTLNSVTDADADSISPGPGLNTATTPKDGRSIRYTPQWF